MAGTTRLVAPNGSTVEVASEKAERLTSQGFRVADDGNAKKSTTTPPRRPSRTEE
jgi:hypothetical protein